MMAMHLCGVTKNLRIGFGFNIVPMWHPLRLAQDFAMADILTGGIMGAAPQTEDRPDVDVALEDWNAKEGLLAAIFIDFLRRAERRG